VLLRLSRGKVHRHAWTQPRWLFVAVLRVAPSASSDVGLAQQAKRPNILVIGGRRRRPPTMCGCSDTRLFVPIQEKLREFFSTMPQFPFQEGSSLTAGNINYNSLKAKKAMDMLKELERNLPVGHY
jgi:hypothetical protein